MCPNRNNKKTVILATFCIFSFCQYGRQRSSRTSGSALITAGAPRQSSPPCYFSYPHLSSYRRLPEREWRRPARTSPPSASQRVRMLSQRLSRNRGRHRFGRLIRPESLLLHLKGKPFFYRLLWELRCSHERGVTVLANTSRAWASFLTFSGWSFSNSAAISAMEVLFVKISLIGRRRRRFLYFAFDKRVLTSFSSRPVHGRPSEQFPESS